MAEEPGHALWLGDEGRLGACVRRNAGMFPSRPRRFASPERVQPGHREQSGRHERGHGTCCTPLVARWRLNWGQVNAANGKFDQFAENPHRLGIGRTAETHAFLRSNWEASKSIEINVAWVIKRHLVEEGVMSKLRIASILFGVTCVVACGGGSTTPGTPATGGAAGASGSGAAGKPAVTGGTSSSGGMTSEGSVGAAAMGAAPSTGGAPSMGGTTPGGGAPGSGGGGAANGSAGGDGASSPMLAFPTAEGSGRYAKGARGGEVYEVTNLNNSGPGSIVDAVSQPNRTVVFRVSGTIPLGDQILQPKSNTTIAGQTAPGDGICIKGRIQIWNYHDIIIRYIRVRVDEGGVNADGDAIDIAGFNEADDKIVNRECRDIIIDHVSVSFSRDENISTRNYTDNVTVQWSIMSEALRLGGSHSYGSLVRGERGQQKTYHHNLYAHNLGRNPRPGNYVPVTEDPKGLYFDFRNNVIYNWEKKKPGYNEDKAEQNSLSRYNFVGNAYIRDDRKVYGYLQRELFDLSGLFCG